MITLTEQYQVTRLRRLNESSRVITARLIQERKNHALVVEALDPKKFAEAAAVLKKLQNIDFGTMSYFRQAVQQATRDVNDALGGSATIDTFSNKLGKIINAAKTKLSDVVKNPIPNALAFASALEQAFEQAESLIQHNFPENISRGLKTNALSQDKVLSKTPRQLVGNRSASLENALVQAFTPEGILAKLGLTWKKRYLDPQKAATTIMDAPLGIVIKAARSFKQGPQMSDVAQSLGGSSSNDSGGTQQGTADTPPVGGGNNAEAEKKSSSTPAQISQDDKDEIVSKIAGLTNVGSKDVEKIIDLLLKRNMLSVRK